MKWLCVPLLAAALLAGCGGDNSSPPTGASGASGASGGQGAIGAGGSSDGESTDQGAGGSSALTAEDESAITDTARAWLTEGGCDLMTDRFLSDQTFVKDRDEACKTFESVFSPPSFSADQITVTDIKGDGDSASATIGDTLGTGVTSKYRFEKAGEGWQIDRASP